MVADLIKSEPSKDYPQQINNWGIVDQLEKVQGTLSNHEIKEFVAPIDNREELQQLEVEQDKLSARIIAIGTASLLTGLATLSVAWLGILLTWKPATRLEKVNRLIRLIKSILNEFEQLGVEVLPLIKVRGHQPIDLFIRFPGKEFLLFAIRSFGESSIVFNESKQALYYKRHKKGLKRWEPDPLTELSKQAYWLRRNKRELFGSSKGVRKPMAKVLVVWNQTKIEVHREHLYTTIGDKKFLFIPREGGACYIIHSTQAVDFIRAWLAHRQSQEEAA